MDATLINKVIKGICKELHPLLMAEVMHDKKHNTISTQTTNNGTPGLSDITNDIKSTNATIVFTHVLDLMGPDDKRGTNHNNSHLTLKGKLSFTKDLFNTLSDIY